MNGKAAPPTIIILQPSMSSELVTRGESTAHNNLSMGGEVAVEVMNLALSIIVALVFGIRPWNRKALRGNGRTDYRLLGQGKREWASV